MTKCRTRERPWMVSVFMAVLLVLPVAGVGTASANPEPSRPELQAVMDSLTSDSASSVIAEAVDEHGRWTSTSGVADLAKRRPAPANGRFRIGSVTKTFVSTVVLQLVGEGRLSLDDTVERWLPGTVPGGNAITVRQLLNHTSGLFNYTNDHTAFLTLGERFLEETRFRTYAPLELVKIATAHPPLFAPGTGWSYSNTGYILVGLIIEKVTGQAWSTEVEDRILEPLGLRHTDLPGTSTGIRGPHSHGYMLVYDGRKVRTVDVTELNPSWVGAAGEIVSTTEDVNRFYAALLGGKLLRPAELAAMKTTVDAGSGFHYGLGLAKMPLSCGVTVWGHDGAIHGYRTLALQTEDGKRQLAASINPILDHAGVRMNELLLAEFCGPDARWRRPGISLHASPLHWCPDARQGTRTGHHAEE